MYLVKVTYCLLGLSFILTMYFSFWNKALTYNTVYVHDNVYSVLVCEENELALKFLHTVLMQESLHT